VAAISRRDKIDHLAELKTRQQWVCANKNKLPFQPNGAPADVANADTWATYDECVAARSASLPYVGFVFSKWDPYVGFDLDEPKTAVELANKNEIYARHKKIFESCATYAEFSPSGKGVHIIGRGSVPKGIHKDCVGLFSEGRYFIFTERPVRGCDRPIADVQNLASAVWVQAGGATNPSGDDGLVDVPAVDTDENIIAMARRATNGDLFERLFDIGFDEREYPSQSEADQALMNIICFYTPSNAQARDIFRQSALGQRRKATKNDVYLNRSIKKIRNEQGALYAAPELVTTPTLTEAPAEDEKPIIEAPEPIKKEKYRPLDHPPGIVGEFSRHIKAAAIRPVDEIAIAGAIALGAGMMGNTFTISRTGLNHYCLILARTGMGKESAASGISSILDAVRPYAPAIDDVIGPAKFMSGQSLLRTLDARKCFVSVMGEFGMTLQQWCDPRAPGSLAMIRQLLIDLYNKSGPQDVINPAVYSDTTKNTMRIQGPAVSILGESTPDTFFAKITSAHVADGFLPRFIAFNYDGERIRKQYDPPPVPAPLVESIIDLMRLVWERAQRKQGPIAVTVSEDARAVLQQYDDLAEDRMNDHDRDDFVQLWNRAHLKVLRLAALIAAGVDWYNPTITYEIAQWATDVINRDVRYFSQMLGTNRFGVTTEAQAVLLWEALTDYSRLKPELRLQYNTPRKACSFSELIPIAYIRRRCQRINAFREDKRGAQRAIDVALTELGDEGRIARIHPKTVENLGLKGIFYRLQ
jgi:hypothetical protein